MAIAVGVGTSLPSRHCAFSEGFGNQLPFVFVDHVAGFVCPDFFHVDAVAFEDVNHFSDARDVFGGVGLEPTDAEAQLVASEGSWLLQILAEPRLKVTQLVCVRACNSLPLPCPRHGLKNSLFNMTVFVLAVDDEADIFAFFQRIVTLKDEAFVLCFHEGEVSGNAREDSTHATSYYLLECFDKRQFLLVERGVFGDGENDTWRMALLQFKGDVIDKQFVAGNGQTSVSFFTTYTQVDRRSHGALGTAYKAFLRPSAGHRGHKSTCGELHRLPTGRRGRERYDQP